MQSIFTGVLLCIIALVEDQLMKVSCKFCGIIAPVMLDLWPCQLWLLEAPGQSIWRDWVWHGTWNLLWLQMLFSPFNSVECVCGIQRGSMVSPSFDWNVPLKRCPRLQCHFPLKCWSEGSKDMWSGGNKRNSLSVFSDLSPVSRLNHPTFCLGEQLTILGQMHPGGAVWIKGKTTQQKTQSSNSLLQSWKRQHLSWPAFPNLSNSQNSRLNETSSVFIRVGRCFSRVNNVLLKNLAYLLHNLCIFAPVPSFDVPTKAINIQQHTKRMLLLLLFWSACVAECF